MTFIGKLFLMLNLAISLLMAVMAFGLYVGGIDWTDRAAKEGQSAGKLKALQTEINDIAARLPVAEASWKAARADVVARENLRRDERFYTDAEMAKLTAGKVRVQMVAPGAGFDERPKMVDADFAPDQPLMTREAYDERLKQHQADNTKLRADLATRVKDDAEETRKLAGDKETDPEPRVRGIRRELVEERVKRQGVLDEQGITESLQVNVAVESGLILKRHDDLNERIGELTRYLKKKHKVDEPAKGR